MTNEAAVELVSVTKRFGHVVAVRDMSLKIRDGEFFSLLGPSGCGKTTTLRMIGGFELPTEGEVLIAGETQGFKPAYQRPVNTVFQTYALFPHMTVYENVAFGLEMKKVHKEGIAGRVRDALAMVQLSGFENRRPKQLSGGQQQRVALARALINRPKVLLLDEPLGALDLKLRKAMQLELKELQNKVGITFIYVTHDQEEALTMSDRIGVMHEGRLLQVGGGQEVYEHPRTRFVADFIGETNFFPASVVQVQQGTAVVALDGIGEVTTLVPSGLTKGQRVMLAVRPEKLRVARDAPAGESIRGRVREVIYVGTDNRYLIRVTEDVEVVVRQQNTASEARADVQKGEQVYVGWARESASLLLD